MPNISATEALQRLMDGNKRFIAGNNVRPHQSPARRIEVADAQHPFAVILGCSDSRVPPEIIFDQGLGDLYVIRTAGHVLCEAVLTSLVHACDYLGVRLIVVLGHRNCGAVVAAVEGDTTGRLAPLIQAIQPAVKKVKLQPSALIDNAVHMHTLLTVRHLQTAAPFISQLVQSGQVQVVGAYYDLASGEVSLTQ